MRNLKNYWTALLFFVVAFFIVSCSDTDELTPDDNTVYDVELNVSEADVTPPNEDVIINPDTVTLIKAKVTFTSTDNNMRRLYITQNISNKGETVFAPLVDVTLKGDSSIDLSTKNDKAFDFAFDLPVPNNLGTNGTIVYKFWTTTGNGDFRNSEKKRAAGPGTITIRYGNGGNSPAPVKSYTTVKLFAPTADGNSKTFVSLLDGNTYNVSQGIEYVSLWDFGYLYSGTDGATLRAPYNYNVPYYSGVLVNPIIDIPAKAGTTNGELNKTYFNESTKSTADFDGISTSDELSFVTATIDDDHIRIADLAVDDVVEFIDQYEKKGLIKVKEINAGNGSDKYIVVAIKVQP